METDSNGLCNRIFHLLPLSIRIRSMGKVMFSQVFVCSQEVCLLGGLPSHNAVGNQTPLHADPPPGKDTTGYRQQAGGTHPTGMHPYCLWILIFFLYSPTLNPWSTFAHSRLDLYVDLSIFHFTFTFTQLGWNACIFGCLLYCKENHFLSYRYVSRLILPSTNFQGLF